MNDREICKKCIYYDDFGCRNNKKFCFNNSEFEDAEMVINAMNEYIESPEFFSKSKEEYISKTGDTSPQKYECMECGCVFYGAWHSEYSISKVKCPICGEETDPNFIKYL